MALVSLNRNGTPNWSLGPKGIRVTTNRSLRPAAKRAIPGFLKGPGYLRGLAFQRDAKIIAVGGIFARVHGQDEDFFEQNVIARFRSNGKLDRSFPSEGVFIPPKAAVAGGPDGGPATSAVRLRSGRVIVSGSETGVHEDAQVLYKFTGR